MLNIKTKVFTKLTIILLILFFTNCSTHGPAFKGKALSRIDKNQVQEFTEERFNKITKYLEDFSETTGMQILHDGKVIYEYGDVSEVSYNASVRKSILSILYGKYVMNETIDLNTTLAEMNIDDVNTLLPIEKTATIHDIISARSGVFHLPVNGGYDKNNALERGSVKPGEYFLYNNWDYNVAGYIFEKYAGKSIYEELETQLAIPLGFQDWNIKNQKKTYNDDKSKYPAYHMYVSTRDMAKIGQLMLNKGEWNGKEIVSKEWIEKSLTVITAKETVNERYGLTDSSDVQNSYGYMWWIFENFNKNPDFEGAYTARGWGGQYITVIPKRKLVISHMTAVSAFVKIGWFNGGVSEAQYWKILDKFMTGKIFLEELSLEMETEEIIKLIRKKISTGNYDFSESSINSYGYRLLNEGLTKEAVKVFRLNTEIYPNQFNTHDSYGESLILAGKKSEALKALKRSLELNRNNENAIKLISELEN